MLRTLLMLAATALPAAAPPAPAWQCRNPDFEASCSDGRCSANSDAFTPMDIGFDEDGHVSACAYSGCWAGPAAMRASSPWSRATWCSNRCWKIRRAAATWPWCSTANREPPC